MPVQEIIHFTAIPGGVSLNAKKLQVSVFIAPRLGGADILQPYPEWRHWTQRRADNGLRITFACAGKTLTLAAPLGQLRPNLWEALFKEDTLVRPFQFADHTGQFIATYPVRWAISALKSTYAAAGVALSLPGGGGLQREGNALIRELIGGYAVNWNQDQGKLWRAQQFDIQQSLANRMVAGRLEKQINLGGDGLAPVSEIKPLTGQTAGVQQSVTQQFAVFSHVPPGAPVTRASLNEEKVLDFHQALTSLNTYPALQRMLGLVFDLELPADFIAPTKDLNDNLLSIVAVDGGWKPDALPSIPQTSTAYIYNDIDKHERLFATAPRNKNDPQILGLLNLAPADFGLAQVDVDGGLHKIITLAETVTSFPGPVGAQNAEVFDPNNVLPSLRSGGLSLYADGRALSLLNSFRQSKKYDQAMQQDDLVKEPFYAEDLVRGYRLDIWDAATGDWHSLHRRNGTYTIGDGELEVKTKDEEGFVQLAATQAAPNKDGTRDSNDLYLHEAIARWAGWSLSVPRPGKHLTRAADPAQAVPDPDNPDPENEPVTPFKMTTLYDIVPRSLPRLRFGGRYRLRARVVDLAGVSLKADDPVTKLLTPLLSLPQGEGLFPYLRFEPVAAPFIVLRDTQAVTGEGSEGSSADRLVIRTFNNSPDKDSDPANLTAGDRHLAPPRSSVEICERHGIFDDPTGKLNASAAMWKLIADRDEGDFPKVELAGMANDGQKQFAALDPDPTIAALPYLPDPLARGAALRDLPGTEDGTFAQVEPGAGAAGPVTYQHLDDPNPRPGSAILVSFNGRDDWQNTVPFRLALGEGSSAPAWDPASRVLSVFLPKGQTKVIRLSSYMEPADLKLMGVWQWLREMIDYITEHSPNEDFYRQYASKDRLAHILQMAVEGGLWLINPPHLLTLVHAVQQPLGSPAFTRLAAQFLRPIPYVTMTKLRTEPESTPTQQTELETLSAWRTPGSADAYLVGSLHVHGASTAKVDLRAAWVDPIDDNDPTHDPTTLTESFSAHVDEVPLAQLDQDYLYSSGSNPRAVGYYVPDKDLICFAPSSTALGNLASGSDITQDAAPRHQIGDAKHHLVTYTAVATSRYRDYFPQQQGGKDVDFTRSSQPVAVHVPASTRPVAPQIAYVVPTFGWQRETQTNQKRSLRQGGGLRVYLNRPWFSSGAGELLGVSLFSTQTYPSNYQGEDWKPFISQWGQDPIWKSTPLTQLPQSYHFPTALASEEALPLDAPTADGAPRRVDVVGFQPEFDPDRNLWYVDLLIEPFTATYNPFIRLALVRYQPHALVEAKLSRAVLADFAQLTPERAATVTADPYHPGELRVVVSGPAPVGPIPDSGDGLPVHLIHPVIHPTVISVKVQEHDPLLQSDLAWKDSPNAGADTLHCGSNLESEAAWRAAPPGSFAVCVDTDAFSDQDPNLRLWAGSIRFHAPLPGKQYRLMIEEREYIQADYVVEAGHMGSRRTFEQPGRLIYAETFPLDDALLAFPPQAAGKTTVE